MPTKKPQLPLITAIALVILAVVGGIVLFARPNSAPENSRTSTTTTTTTTTGTQTTTTTTVPGRKGQAKSVTLTLASGEMSLVGPGAQVAAGDTITVSVYENSGTEAANAAQFLMRYDPQRFEYAGLGVAGDFDIVAATDTSTPGMIRAARGNAAGLTGIKRVASVLLLVKPVSGTTDLTLDSVETQLVRSSDATSILTKITNTTVQVR